MSELEAAGTPDAPVPGVPERIRTGFAAGVRTALKIIKITVPLYIAVALLQHTPVLDRLGHLFGPVMGLFGLPGETAFAFVAAFLLNIYAAIAVIAPLHLTPFQVTQCGLMMGLAHNLVVEGGVLSSTGARGAVLSVCRILVAFAGGLLLRGLWRLWDAAVSGSLPFPGLS